MSGIGRITLFPESVHVPMMAHVPGVAYTWTNELEPLLPSAEPDAVKHTANHGAGPDDVFYGQGSNRSCKSVWLHDRWFGV